VIRRNFRRFGLTPPFFDGAGLAAALGFFAPPFHGGNGAKVAARLALAFLGKVHVAPLDGGGALSFKRLVGVFPAGGFEGEPGPLKGAAAHLGVMLPPAF
jgi:hypothetical protein